jgi:hypothetical protein
VKSLNVELFFSLLYNLIFLVRCHLAVYKGGAVFLHLAVAKRVAWVFKLVNDMVIRRLRRNTRKNRSPLVSAELVLSSVSDEKQLNKLILMR